MGTYGDSITQPIPAVGTSGTTYATEIDAFLTEVKTRLESKVPLSSIASGALDLSNNPLANAEYVSLYAQLSTPSTPVGSLQNFANDLYWVSGAGAVKLTTGSAINIAGINGITGDYGGVNPAQFRFVDVDQEYYAYDDFGGGAWARVWAKNFDIAAGATSSTRVRLDATGVGASYTLNLPTAVPATQKLVQMTTAGALITSGVLANNENIQLQGTGYIQRGSRVTTVPIMGINGFCSLISGGAPTFTGASWGFNHPVSTQVYYMLQLPDWDNKLMRITSVLVRNSIVGTGTVTWALVTSETTIGTVGTAVPGASTTGIASSITITPSPIFDITGAGLGACLWLSVTTPGTASGKLYSAEITTTVP